MDAAGTVPTIIEALPLVILEESVPALPGCLLERSIPRHLLLDL